MPYYNRKRNRLKNYNYSKNGAYFVTICTKDKQKILSNITHTVGDGFAVPKAENKIAHTVGDGFAVPKVQLTKYGEIVDEYIQKIKEKYKGINIDKYVIMPNHIHIMIKINGRSMIAPTISRVIKHFKGAVTKKIGYSIWQKSFHDHIVRNEKEYNMISEYIRSNPFNWEKDCFYQQ